MAGDFTEAAPSLAQLAALRALLLELKLAYPDTEVGGHRQVRGEQTDCPGRGFGLGELLDWSRDALPKARDEAVHDLFAKSYTMP